MKNKNYISSLIVIIGICVISCSSDKNKITTHEAERSQQIETVDKGKLLFEEKCTACHGSDGTAGIANAANLQTGELDNISIIRIITNGKNTMPAFKDQLSAAEIEQISNYVHTLHK